MLYLPNWLPDSTLLKTKGGELFCVEYTVRAQFIPNNPRDYATDSRIPERYQNISIYRGSRKILVYQPFLQHPRIDYVRKIEANVGAVLGMGGSKSTSTITFVQNQFYPGEQLRFLLECDNSKCKVAVKNFKFKCFRIITQKDPLSGDIKTSEQKVFAFKEAGIAANKSTRREFVFDIPLTIKED